MSWFQLPLYPDDAPARAYQLIPEEPLPLQREFATIRTAFNTVRSSVDPIVRKIV